jgi:hypothetical protein
MFRVYKNSRVESVGEKVRLRRFRNFDVTFVWWKVVPFTSMYKHLSFRAAAESQVLPSTTGMCLRAEGKSFRDCAGDVNIGRSGVEGIPDGMRGKSRVPVLNLLVLRRKSGMLHQPRIQVNYHA